MSGTFQLSIELGNAAMSTPADVGRALEKVAAALVVGSWDGIESGHIRDENGNTVGSWDVEVEDDGPDDDGEGYCRAHGSYDVDHYSGTCPSCVAAAEARAYLGG